jgi:hypothetical protein
MKPYRIPPLITDIVRTAVSSVDGMEFSHAASCPSCGGRLQGYDWKKRKFAVLREETGNRVVTVRVKRFYCRDCGGLWYADEPFYPDSRIGSPVIDIFFALSAAMPPGRAARVIDALGIMVDRTTWKHYTGRSPAGIPVVDVFGMRLPLCIVQLSDIAVRTDQPDPAAVIVACGHPSRRKLNTL